MISTTNDELVIQADIDQLKTQWPITRELYREACLVLFFRYGISPTANKLYHYVRKGSMSAPTEAVKRFWAELRDKSRLRLDGYDLPEPIKDAAGQLLMSLWKTASDAAESNFKSQTLQADQHIQSAKSQVVNMRQEQLKLKSELENALDRISQSEKKHASDISALAGAEKSILALQSELSICKQQLVDTQSAFRQDLSTVDQALQLAEGRYRDLESRSLMELDRERQSRLKTESELVKHKKKLDIELREHLKQVAMTNKRLVPLVEQNGRLKGELTSIKLILKQRDRAILQLNKKLQPR